MALIDTPAQAQAPAPQQPQQAQPQAPEQPRAQAPEQPQVQKPDAKTLALMQRLALAAMKIIYSKSAADKLVKAMEQLKDDPVEALAQLASHVIAQLQGSAPIPENSALLVSMHVIVMLADLARAAGLFEADDVMVAQAMKKLQGFVEGPEQKEKPEPQPEQPAQQAPQAQPGLIAS